MGHNKIRAIALYLPQFHPTPENDVWWGKGFTEWTNVAKARPLFPGHYQPHIPADLGFYDLRLPETRQAQADLAKKYGIEGFCYWHYWFGNGKRLLERPFNEVLNSGKPDFPFCLSWANHSWQRKLWNYDGKGNIMLIEQTYPGENDIIAHFYDVLPAFKDKRYITVDGKPIFGIFSPLDHPQMASFITIWRSLAEKNGLKGIYFVGHGNISHRTTILSLGFDAFNDIPTFDILNSKNLIWKFIIKVKSRLFKWPITFRYSDAMKYWIHTESRQINTIPSVIPNWDHSPRSNTKAVILTHSTPELFRKHVAQVVDLIKQKPYEHRLLFIKSWNEWGEGNHLEPDLKYGNGYLSVFSETINNA